MILKDESVLALIVAGGSSVINRRENTLVFLEYRYVGWLLLGFFYAQQEGIAPCKCLHQSTRLPSNIWFLSRGQ